MVLAKKKYMAAVRYVASELQDPKKANLVDTLKSVMVLAIFELVNSSSQYTENWGVHIEGAAALLMSLKTRQNMDLHTNS